MGQKKKTPLLLLNWFLGIILIMLRISMAYERKKTDLDKLDVHL